MIKTAGLVVLLAIGGLLNGCAALGIDDTATDAVEPKVEVRTVTRTVEVEKPSESTTVRLIEVLGEQGCDFAGITIAEWTKRKGSSTVQVGCK